MPLHLTSRYNPCIQLRICSASIYLTDYCCASCKLPYSLVGLLYSVYRWQPMPVRLPKWTTTTKRQPSRYRVSQFYPSSCVSYTSQCLEPMPFVFSPLPHPNFLSFWSRMQTGGLFELMSSKNVCHFVAIIIHIQAEIRVLFVPVSVGALVFSPVVLHLQRACPVGHCGSTEVKFPHCFSGAISSTYFFMMTEDTHRNEDRSITSSTLLCNSTLTQWSAVSLQIRLVYGVRSRTTCKIRRTGGSMWWWSYVSYLQPFCCWASLSVESSLATNKHSTEVWYKPAHRHTD